MKIENGVIKAVIDEILQLESTEIINLFNKLNDDGDRYDGDLYYTELDIYPDCFNEGLNLDISIMLQGHLMEIDRVSLGWVELRELIGKKIKINLNPCLKYK